MSEEENVTKPAKKKKEVIILAIAAVVIVALLGVIIFLLLKKDAAPEQDVLSDRSTLVTKDNLEEVRQDLNTPVEDGYYETRMSVDWTFENGTAASTDFFVENVTENTRTVYFDVTIPSTGEEVYSSPYMPVGSKLDSITLTKDLDAGDYSGVVTYHLVDDKNAEISTVSVGVTLHVLN